MQCWSARLRKKNGQLTQAYFDTANVKKGIKKECGELIDYFKKYRKKAHISNKSEQSWMKPLKLADVDFENQLMEQPMTKNLNL